MKTLIEAIIERKFTVKRTGKRWAKTIEHDSLVLDLENNVFYWNSKGVQGGAYHWLTEVEGMNHFEATKVLEEYSSLYPSNYHIQFREGKEVVTYPKLVDLFWENGKEFRQYWYERKLTDDTIDKFRLGNVDGWFTIPIFEEYTLKNIQMRRDYPDKRITKWYRGTGISLWGDDILTRSDWVIFTEGLVDGILLRQFDLPSITTDAGSGAWRDDFLIKFKNQNLIYVVYDNDSAGKKGAKRLAKRLGTSRCRLYTFDGFEDKYDIVDFFKDGNSPEDFIDLLEHNYYMVE